VPALARALDVTTVGDPVQAGALQLSAAGALGAMGPAAGAAVPALVNLLRGGKASPDVSRHVIETLGKIGPAATDAAPVLTGILGDKARLSEASAAAASLGRIGPAAVPALQNLLKAKDPYVRGRALEALGAVGPAAREAVPAVQEALKDPNPGI